MSGLAWPFRAFITWPVKNPLLLSLPALILATTSGFAASTRSTSAAMAESSETAARPRAATIACGDLAGLEHLGENSLGAGVGDLAAVPQCDQLAQSGRA